MKLPQETELISQKITFYKLTNFILSIVILATAVYGIGLLFKALFV
jgi:hypothetical protein